MSVSAVSLLYQLKALSGPCPRSSRQRSGRRRAMGSGLRSSAYLRPSLWSSVAVLGQTAPIVGRRATGHRGDAVLADMRMHRPHPGYFEPQPQQMAAPVLFRVTVVEGGAGMQDRVIINEVHLARA